MNKQNPGTGWCEYTWSPITGCLNHTNGLCKGGGFPCYAYKLANGRLKQRYLANENYRTSVDFRNGAFKPDAGAPNDPFYPRFWPERLREPMSLKTPGKIFVVDMGELFGDWVPREWQHAIFTRIRACPQHTFQLLTKQPQNLAKWSPFPENCCVGFTATNLLMFLSGIGYLRNVTASIKFVSIEPLLAWSTGGRDWEWREYLSILDWLILGLQTPYSPKTAPKIEHVQEIVEACQKAQIPYFLKDNLSPLLGKNLVQDMPKRKRAMPLEWLGIRELEIRKISEKEFLEQVLALGKLYHWRCAHFRHALQRDGKYLTPVQADGAGFPDLVMVRDERVVWAELKSEKGRVSDRQLEWIKALAKAKQKEVYVWRPSQWEELEEILR